MNWKEFLEKAKEAGVKDNDKITYMDFSGSDNIHFEFDDHTYADGSPRPRRIIVQG